MRKTELSELAVQHLRAAVGKCELNHVYLSTQALFSDLRLEVPESPTEHGAPCLPCHAAMEARAIAYCRENGIRWLGLGSTPDSQLTYDQNIRGVSRTESFLARYGLHLTVPLWEQPERNGLEELYHAGIVPHTKMGKRYGFANPNPTQGNCPLGIWNTLDFKRHEHRHGFLHYLEACETYRARLETRCEAHLREVHGVLPLEA